MYTLNKRTRLIPSNVVIALTLHILKLMMASRSQNIIQNAKCHLIEWNNYNDMVPSIVQ